MCCSLKFISEAIHFILVSLYFELIFTWYTAIRHCFVILKFFSSEPLKTIKVALHIRWLTTEKFQNNEAVKGGCILY